jgi:hypothetical protein
MGNKDTTLPLTNLKFIKTVLGYNIHLIILLNLLLLLVAVGVAQAIHLVVLTAELEVVVQVAIVHLLLVNRLAAGLLQKTHY